MRPTLIENLAGKGDKLIESYNSGNQMALGRKKGPNTYELCTAWFYCKDYVQDVFWASINGRPAEIYGMRYDPSKDLPIPEDKLILMMRAGKGSPDNFLSMARAGAVLLRQLDKAVKFSSTRVRCSEEAKVAVYEADIRWTHSPALLSLYTLLMRVSVSIPPKRGRTLKSVIDEFVEKRADTAAWKVYTQGWSSQQTTDVGRLVQLAKDGHFKYLVDQNLSLFASNRRDNYPASSNVGTMHGQGVMRWMSTTKVVP